MHIIDAPARAQLLKTRICHALISSSRGRCLAPTPEPGEGVLLDQRAIESETPAADPLVLANAARQPAAVFARADIDARDGEADEDVDNGEPAEETNVNAEDLSAEDGGNTEHCELMAAVEDDLAEVLQESSGR